MKTKNLVEAFATLFSFVIVFALIGVLTASFSKSSGKDTDNIKSEQDIIQSACTHTFGEWRITEKATCSVKGTQSRICSLCEYEDTKEIAITPHNLTETMYQAPTCTEIGTRQTKCKDCQQYFLEELPPTHKYSALTCTENSVCSVCGKVGQVATGHNIVTDYAVAPTCTTIGLTEGSHCSVCNTILVAQAEIPATGHTEVVIKAIAPTCDNYGLTEGKKCSVCNKILVEQETVDALPHTKTTTWKQASNGSWYKDCTVCGTKIETTAYLTFTMRVDVEKVTYYPPSVNYITDYCCSIGTDKAYVLNQTVKTNETLTITLSPVKTDSGYMILSVKSASNCKYTLTQTNSTTYTLTITNIVGNVNITITGQEP